MFNRLMDYGYKRNWKEAIGFYVAYLLLIVLLGGLVGGLLALALPAKYNIYDFGVRVGTFMAVAVTMGVAVLILVKKELTSRFLYLFLVFLAGLMTLIGGGVLGLLPVAFLTTREKSSVVVSDGKI